MAEHRVSLKIPPHSNESERALLGSLLVRPEAIHDALELVNQDSFYAERHQTIFATVIELAQKGAPIDMVSVGNRLKEKGLLESAGGQAYLAELPDAAASPSNAVHYAEVVQKKAAARGLIRAAEDVLAQAYDESAELDELLDRAEKRVFEATDVRGQGRYLLEIKDTLVEAWDRLERLSREGGKELRGVSTGFAALDNKISGFQKADLIILAARPSMGKTSLALDFARAVGIHQKQPVAVFSLEMSSQQLADRMLSAESSVDSWKLRTGKGLTDQDFEALSGAMSRMNEAPIFIDERSVVTPISIRSSARRIKAERGLGLIIVDYLQLVHPVTSAKSDSVVQQVTEISRGLKSVARELDVPVLALSQLSRKVEERGGKPRLSDLRDSGSIEQDADIVMFIHREDKYNDAADRPGIAQIMIEKHRNGPTGIVELGFNDKCTSFIPVDSSYAASIDAF
jgi:replicative DNA helicase